MNPRLKDKIFNEIQSSLKEKFGYKNIYMGPSIQKVIINMGLGLDGNDAKILKSSEEDLAKIAGQKPVITKFKKSIANFKLREGQIIGLTVTLRGYNMWHFLDRLLNIALPRVRDFRGVSSKSFDGNGNYTLGLNEQLVFPEVEYDKVRDIRGMNITICTSANDNNQGYVLLQALGFPFREN